MSLHGLSTDMHILFLTENFPPEGNSPATRTFEHTREWAVQGHNVTVITCAPIFQVEKYLKVIKTIGCRKNKSKGSMFGL